MWFDRSDECSPESPFDNLSRSHHQSQLKGCCQSNVLSPACINWLVSFAVMLLAVRLKWRRSVVIGRKRNVSHHDRQQSFSGLHSLGRSNYTITCYLRVQTIYCKTNNVSKTPSSMSSDWHTLRNKIIFLLPPPPTKFKNTISPQPTGSNCIRSITKIFLNPSLVTFSNEACAKSVLLKKTVLRIFKNKRK